ncbi:MAG: helix-turn-helix domain-containing protein [Patescibacteria group bacterium]
MTKKEIVWREILHQALTKKNTTLTQKDLAQTFGISLSTVFNALKLPRQSGAIRVDGRNFTVVDGEKLLYLWATERNLEKETLYTTHTDLSPREIEGMMPSEAVFACYSAYRLKYGDAPADYDKVYVYAGTEEIRQRFPPQEGYANVIVLKADQTLRDFGSTSPDVQTFADLWNAKEWYAKEFLNALKTKLFT